VGKKDRPGEPRAGVDGEAVIFLMGTAKLLEWFII
jgi:hypothetical protein